MKTKTTTVLLFLSIGLIQGAVAQTFERAGMVAKSDLDAAIKKLADVRRAVEQAKIPLSKELSGLETDALIKRKEADRVRRLRDNRAVDLNTMRNRKSKLQENNIYLSSLLNDYIRRFESQIHIGEVQIYEDLLSEARSAPENINLSGNEKFAAQSEVLDTAFERIERIMGGEVFNGNAVTPKSIFEDGQFAILGPVAYFASSESTQAGLAQLETNSVNAAVKDIGEQFAPGIRHLVDNRSGTVAFDTTMGDAIKATQIKEPIWSRTHIRKGGPVMIPILLLAAIAILIAIIKWFQIGAVKRARPIDLATILRHLKNDQKDEALAYAKGVKGPVGQMLSTAVEHADEDRDLIEEVLYEKIIITQPKLERMLPFIAVTAATSPLLGLLGTVTGMIKTFKLITVFGTGDAKSLSSGISEALITTEFGLIIAIPALIMHALLSRKAKGVVASMEQTAVGFINGISEKDKG